MDILKGIPDADCREIGLAVLARIDATITPGEWRAVITHAMTRLGVSGRTKMRIDALLAECEDTAPTGIAVAHTHFGEVFMPGCPGCDAECKETGARATSTRCSLTPSATS